MTGTIIVVGLGNPGARYAANRHNVGFRVLDELARRRGAGFTTGGGGAWATATGGPLVLVKPLTFMNRSGEALAAWSRSAAIPLAVAPERPAASAETGPETAVAEPAAGVRPLVVCDDLALPLGSLRLRPRGSSGGQNGLGDIIEILGGEEFPRLRLGIAPLAEEVDPADWPGFVLEDFAADEAEAAAEMVLRAADAVDHWASHGLEDTVARFNRRVRREAED